MTPDRRGLSRLKRVGPVASTDERRDLTPEELAELRASDARMAAQLPALIDATLLAGRVTDAVLLARLYDDLVEGGTGDATV